MYIASSIHCIRGKFEPQVVFFIGGCVFIGGLAVKLCRRYFAAVKGEAVLFAVTGEYNCIAVEIGGLGAESELREAALFSVCCN